MQDEEMLEIEALETEDIQDSASEEDEQSSETEVDDVEADEEAETEDAEDEEDEFNLDDDDEGVSEVEEVEFEGKNYKVHPDLKLALMRNADYTQKSQGVAEDRRTLEQREEAFEQQVQVYQELRSEYAKFEAIQGQIDQYKNVDWNALEEQDPIEAGRHWRSFQQMKDSQQQLAAGIRHKEHECSQAAQREAAKRDEEYVQARNKVIPDWSEQLNLQLTDFAKTYGFTQDDVGSLRDPRMLQILREAMDGRQLKTKLQEKRKAAKKPKPKQDVKPLKKQAKGRTSAPKGLSDDMSPEAWVAARNKQVAARRGY
ncbi:hypothetical protein [uncultured Roseibium sp.]|uniref:hypothetical protein n=1 Tax=uncultured Roseibium sp. TaxID=1936171 RepID=UPI002611DA0D|nr:hypothetical protein [uncultured Roseibium sp.]